MAMKDVATGVVYSYCAATELFMFLFFAKGIG